MPDQKSDQNDIEEEIAEIIAETPSEKSIKPPKPAKGGRFNKWMDKLANLILRAIIFGLVAGGVGVAVILVVPPQFLPNSPAPEILENSQIMEERVDNVTEIVGRLQTSVIPEIEGRIETLEESVNQVGSNLLASNNQSNSLFSELESLSKIIETQSKQITGLEANFDDLFLRHDTLRDEVETTTIALEESYFDFLYTLEEFEVEKRILQEDLADLAYTISMGTYVDVDSVDRETGLITPGSSENNQPLGTNSQLVMLESRLLRLGERIQEIDNLSRSLANLGNEVSELRMEIADISTTQVQMNEIGGEIQHISTQLPELETELSNLNDQNQTIADQVVRLQENTAQMEMQLVSLSSLAMGENSLRNLTLIGIQAAVEAGIPYAAIIGESEINRLELPSIILDLSEDGVATLAELQNEFEELITEALKAVETGAESGSIQDMARSIVTSLVQVRSLTPREGDDAVAVLSRLEESLNKGNLESVLELYAQLPPSVQDTLATWQHKIQNRLDLIQALEMSFSKPASPTGQ